MSHLHRILAAAIGLALLGSGSAVAQKKVYCWNENGKKVCGDALPAEAADSARTEISAKSGLRTGQVARALTDAERTDAALAADAARRDAEAEAMVKRRDLAMVESYMTEADLRRAYGERTELLDETLKASTLGLSNLRLSLLSLLRQAGDKELAAEPVPKRLADTIRSQHDELLRQQQILSVQQKDRAALDAELNDAVARYRALKAATGEAAATTTTPAPAAAPPR
jgi:hypothetical protein